MVQGSKGGISSFAGKCGILLVAGLPDLDSEIPSSSTRCVARTVPSSQQSHSINGDGSVERKIKCGLDYVLESGTKQ